MPEGKTGTFGSTLDSVDTTGHRSSACEINRAARRRFDEMTAGRILQAPLVIAGITPSERQLEARGTQLPFDVSAFRALFCEDSIGGKAKLEQGL
jgi:hypothetical protein